MPLRCRLICIALRLYAYYWDVSCWEIYTHFWIEVAWFTLSPNFMPQFYFSFLDFLENIFLGFLSVLKFLLNFLWHFFLETFSIALEPEPPINNPANFEHNLEKLKFDSEKVDDSTILTKEDYIKHSDDLWVKDREKSYLFFVAVAFALVQLAAQIEVP